MIAYSSSSHKCKWIKTKWLVEDDYMKQFVPETRQFTADNLADMLSNHASIYFKPTNGSGGARIVKISRKEEHLSAKHGSTQRKFSSQEELLKWMNQFAGTRSFLLQQGITLAKSNGKPFDVRVMVQKTKAGQWKATAIFCKVGKENKVTTNYSQGGTLNYIDPTLKGAGFDSSTREALKSELRQLGLKVAHIFSKKNSGFKELGLDVAIDDEGKLWILEVNTRPQFFPLKNLEDKSLYLKILSYAKQYGRKK